MKGRREFLKDTATGTLIVGARKMNSDWPAFTS